MAGWIEEHCPSLIGLRFGKPRSELEGPLDWRFELLAGSEVEVHDRRAWPDRRAVVGDLLRDEQQAR